MPGGNPKARSVMKNKQKSEAKNNGTPHVGEYSLIELGGSLNCTVSSTALDIFGLSKGDTIHQYVDFENNAIIIMPEDNHE